MLVWPHQEVLRFHFAELGGVDQGVIQVQDEAEPPLAQQRAHRALLHVRAVHATAARAGAPQVPPVYEGSLPSRTYTRLTASMGRPG